MHPVGTFLALCTSGMRVSPSRGRVAKIGCPFCGSLQASSAIALLPAVCGVRQQLLKVHPLGKRHPPLRSPSFPLRPPFLQAVRWLAKVLVKSEGGSAGNGSRLSWHRRWAGNYSVGSIICVEPIVLIVRSIGVKGGNKAGVRKFVSKL